MWPNGDVIPGMEKKRYSTHPQTSQHLKDAVNKKSQPAAPAKGASKAGKKGDNSAAGRGHKKDAKGVDPDELQKVPVPRTAPVDEVLRKKEAQRLKELEDETAKKKTKKSSKSAKKTSQTGGGGGGGVRGSQRTKDSQNPPKVKQTEVTDKQPVATTAAEKAQGRASQKKVATTTATVVAGATVTLPAAGTLDAEVKPSAKSEEDSATASKATVVAEVEGAGAAAVDVNTAATAGDESKLTKHPGADAGKSGEDSPQQEELKDNEEDGTVVNREHAEFEVVQASDFKRSSIKEDELDHDGPAKASWESWKGTMLIAAFIYMTAATAYAGYLFAKS